MVTLITGGSASGKSMYGERLVTEREPGRRIYVATMIPWDKECEERIARHRQMRREKRFETIECYRNLQKLSVSPNEESSTILLECLSNLTANEMYREDRELEEISGEAVAEHILFGLRYLQKQASNLIIITNEVFSDGEIYPTETMEYQKALGLLNQKLAAWADEVVEVVYGIPLRIK